jgi:thioredoxin-like negative regulator of GroEL
MAEVISGEKIEIVKDYRSYVAELHTREEFEEFKKHSRAVIFYGAKWCNACQDLEPLYGRIAARYHKRIKLAHVDVEDSGLDFTAVPVFVSFRKGIIINEILGTDKKGLKQFIREAIQIK